MTTNRVELFENDDIEITGLYRYSGSGLRTRVFVSGHGNPEMPMPAFSVKGKDAENDKAWRAYNKRAVELMRELAIEGLDLLDADYGKLSFSRKAGCGCGCSAGFFAENWMGYEAIYVTRKTGPVQLSLDI